MQYEIKMEVIFYVLSFLIIVILPIALSAGVEFVITRQVSSKVIIFITLFCIGTYSLILLQLVQSKINLESNKLDITSPLYSKSVDLDQIKDIIFFPHGLPEGMTLKIRRNGLSVPGYWAGKYILDNNDKAFVLMAKPPYAVITDEATNYKYIISLTEDFYLKIIDEWK